MSPIKIRHLLVKRLADGEVGYYWNPTRRMRDLGFAPESLGRDLVRAIARAEELNQQWDAVQAGRTEGPASGTISWLINDHQKSDRYKNRSAAANEEVDRAFKIIGAEFGEFKAAAVRLRHCEAFYARLRKEGSDHRANMVMKWTRYLFNRAIAKELIVANPAANVELVALDSRDVIWEDAEVAAMEEAAVAQGRPSVALAIRLAYDLGQRLSDLLCLTWTAYDGSSVTVRQSKTAAHRKKKGKAPKLIVIDVLPELKERLDAAPKLERSPQIVVSEHKGRPYTRFHFNRLFRETRDEVAKILPAVAEKQFLDYRRSSAVRLAEAGCTTEEIVAITGHDIAHGERILEAYVPRTAVMGRNAIAKLGEARLKRGKSK
ncbi:MAG: hypothetical protein FJX54_18160 [Alphaproteobacteria bacterium]|nr:hypothetical protein [Alphaproteobacteria bacterium]